MSYEKGLLAKSPPVAGRHGLDVDPTHDSQCILKMDLRTCPRHCVSGISQHRFESDIRWDANPQVQRFLESNPPSSLHRILLSSSPITLLSAQIQTCHFSLQQFFSLPLFGSIEKLFHGHGLWDMPLLDRRVKRLPVVPES